MNNGILMSSTDCVHLQASNLSNRVNFHSYLLLYFIRTTAYRLKIFVALISEH